jgi:hypothetical protein
MVFDFIRSDKEGEKMSRNNRTFILNLFSKLAHVILLTVLLSGLQLPPVVHAATVTVDITNDELDGADGGACASANIADYDGDGGALSDISLREAICWANASAGADTITVPAGTYTLSIPNVNEDDLSSSCANNACDNTQGDLDISEDLTVNGAGQGSTIIDANDTDRIFHINDSGADTIAVTVTDMTIQDGTPRENGVLRGSGGCIFLDEGGPLTLTSVTLDSCTSPNSNGGGVRGDANTGTLTIQNSVISNNTVGSGGSGGGIYAASTLVLADSTVSGNSTTGTGDGGGIRIETDATITNVTISGNTSNDEGGGIDSTLSGAETANITNSTISGNRAMDFGGGVVHDNTGTVTLNFTTVTLNVADDDDNGTGSGGGIRQGSTGVVNIQNSIVQGNVDESPATSDDCFGTVTSLGGNVVGSGTGCPSGGADDTTAAANLGTLADNGGSTQTHALATGSAAIDRTANGVRSCGGSVTDDQRGATRPLDGDANGTASCDAGAFEMGALQCSIQSDIEPTTYTFFGDTVSIEVTDDGTDLDCLRATDIPHNHPNATSTSGGSGIMTGRYWILEGLQSDQSTAATEDYSLNLTLAHSVSPDSNAYVCKYPGGLGGYGWDCSRTSSTVSTVWRNGISSLSDWAVGDQVGPTALTLHGASAQSRAGIYSGVLLMAVLVLGGSGMVLTRRMRRS